MRGEIFMPMLSDLPELLLGLSLKADDLNIAQVALRAVLVYGALIAFVRLGKKRFLAQATAFDAILLILIGSIASRGVSGTAPFFASVLASGWLIALHSLISYLSCGSPRFSRLVKGNSTTIIKGGRVDHEAMKAAHMTDDDLREDLRKNGVRHASEVAEARLERDGRLSVLKG
jgi:uncharacterized membrane protein YcaP (DUF421 family)